MNANITFYMEIDSCDKEFIGWDRLLSAEQREGDKSQSSPINPLLRKSECNNVFIS